MHGGPEKAAMDDLRSEMSSRASMYFGPPRPGSAAGSVAGSVYGAGNYGYHQGAVTNMHIAAPHQHVNIPMSMAGGDIQCDASVAGMSLANNHCYNMPGVPMAPMQNYAMQGPGIGHSAVADNGQLVHYPSGMPNEVLMQSVRRILSTADLMLVTKKQVRQQVALDCNMDQEELSARKSFINLCIDEVLSERL
ncbi:hypothetical protein GGI11_008214 [Coemansia sp. RSA 2049]|nr:hypothetical protein GGI11_008214 [Coemansia sp. RSA 2049]